MEQVQVGPRLAAVALRQEEAELLKRMQAEKEGLGRWSLRRLLEQRRTRLDLQLRRCQPADFPTLQARARAFEELLEEIR